ncbi:MAG: cbb3-type cytochrome c oxidase subunit 3 [Aquabacterium sp.]|jgi:cytochrome c oxidase cbb3-type subunit 4|nr:MAG: cbb3-type cytochrome c oxidase subunit 3 [Aquabacterium sp.]
MDLNLLRSLVTVLSFAIFIGIMAWTYARANRGRFDEAARLPFEEPAAAQSGTARGERA